ncbi:MAG: archease [Candidatus Aenigmarchaeota archaeon]|nr:archease [Candidatus Aenigmarchaeota archaeon]
MCEVGCMYKFVDDLTSDVMFVAEGKNLAELLEQASMALFEVVCQRDKVEPKEFIEIKVEADSPRELVHEWLSKLLTESDINEMFFSKFDVEVEKKDGKLIARGKAWGEPYSPEKGETVVKGVTYYNFSVEKTKDGWRAKVVCDI